MNSKALLTIGAACLVTAAIASTATALLTRGMNQAHANPIQDKVLQAESFDLINSKGESRGSFRVGKKSGLPVFMMLDDKGTNRLNIGLAKDGSPVIVLSDEQDKTRVSIALAKSGEGTINLLDGKGEIRGMLSMDSKGDVSLSQYDEKGKRIEK